MKLTDRVDAVVGRPVHAAAPSPSNGHDAQVTHVVRHAAGPSRARRLEEAHRAPKIVDPFAEFKERAAQALFERIGTRLNDNSLTDEKLHAYTRGELIQIVAEEQVPLSTEERNVMIEEIEADVLGLGPLERLLDDPAVTEIMVNGPDQIYIEQSGHLTL